MLAFQRYLLVELADYHMVKTVARFLLSLFPQSQVKAELKSRQGKAWLHLAKPDGGVLLGSASPAIAAVW